MRRWFLSYNSQDLHIARALEAELKSKDADATIYFAPKSLRPGAYWMPALAKEIAEATAFVLLISAYSRTRPTSSGPSRQLGSRQIVARSGGRARLYPFVDSWQAFQSRANTVPVTFAAAAPLNGYTTAALCCHFICAEPPA
jgi:hypothetical protein